MISYPRDEVVAHMRAIADAVAADDRVARITRSPQPGCITFLDTAGHYVGYADPLFGVVDLFDPEQPG